MFGFHAAGDRDAMIEAGPTPQQGRRADPRIAGAVDEAAYTGVDHGADAHQARLESDVEGRADQTIVAGRAGGAAQCDDLGVSGRIGGAGRGISPPPDDPVVRYDDGPDRHLAPLRGAATQPDRSIHPTTVALLLRPASRSAGGDARPCHDRRESSTRLRPSCAASGGLTLPPRTLN